VQVDKTQTVSAFTLESGAYDITVEETGDLTCDQAREDFRDILLAPGAKLPAGWELDLDSHTFSRQDGSHAFSVNPVVQAAVSGGGFWDDLENWAVIWLPIIFMALIAGFLLLTVRYMPRTRPQQIKPS